MKSGNCFAAKLQSTIVGFAVYSASFYENGFISLVVVSPNYRRIGIAAALIRYVEFVCKTEKIYSSTNRSNTVAHRLFESLGYLRSGRIKNLDVGDEEVVYYKLLIKESCNLEIREIDASIKKEIEVFRGPMVVSRGKVHRLENLPGYVVLINGKVNGLITYQIDKEE